MLAQQVRCGPSGPRDLPPAPAPEQAAATAGGACAHADGVDQLQCLPAARRVGAAGLNSPRASTHLAAPHPPLEPAAHLRCRGVDLHVCVAAQAAHRQAARGQHHPALPRLEIPAGAGLKLGVAAAAQAWVRAAAAACLQVPGRLPGAHSASPCPWRHPPQQRPRSGVRQVPSRQRLQHASLQRLPCLRRGILRQSEHASAVIPQLARQRHLALSLVGQVGAGRQGSACKRWPPPPASTHLVEQLRRRLGHARLLRLGHYQ